MCGTMSTTKGATPNNKENEMLSRREYEEFFGKISDQDWAKLVKQMSDIQDRMWEEDHPLDD